MWLLVSFPVESCELHLLESMWHQCNNMDGYLRLGYDHDSEAIAFHRSQHTSKFHPY